MATGAILSVVFGLVLADGHPRVVHISPDGSEGSLLPEPPAQTAPPEVMADGVANPIPLPRLPPGYAARDANDVKRVLRMIENEVVSVAMVSRAFVDGITGPLAQRFATVQRPYIHPSAIYYAIVYEAAHRHGNKTAARNLLVKYRDGTIARYAKMPHRKRSLD